MSEGWRGSRWGKLNTDEISQIHALAAEGQSATEIGSELNHPRSTVRSVLARTNGTAPAANGRATRGDDLEAIRARLDAHWKRLTVDQKLDLALRG